MAMCLLIRYNSVYFKKATIDDLNENNAITHYVIVWLANDWLVF